MKSTVTICIPAFNAAGFLEETLESIQGQAFKNWELVVVEDGSDDGTRGIVEAFRSSVTQKVCYLRHDANRGLTATRNTGIRAATTNWIAILDADDLWQPDHLSKLWEQAQTGKFNLVYSGSILFEHGSGRQLEVRAPDESMLSTFPLSLFLSRYAIQPSSVLLEKALWERVGGFDESFQHVEDREMWLRCARAGAVFSFTGSNTCLYRKHASAMSGQSLPMALACARVINRHLDWMSIPQSVRLRSAFQAWIAAARLAWRTRPFMAAQCVLRALITPATASFRQLLAGVPSPSSRVGSAARSV